MSNNKDIIKLETTDSTNKYAVQLLQKGVVPEYTVVTARNQIAGRGQRGNSWESENGKNITMSMVLYPRQVTPSQQFIISQLISLAIVDFLDQNNIKASIKWPNDIYTGRKKICGILIENSLQGSSINHSVAGIGLNVNQTNFISDAPNPVSMQQITGEQYDLEIIQDGLISCLKYRLDKFSTENCLKIKDEYETLLFRKGTCAGYKYPDGELFEGTILGVEDKGHLKIDIKGEGLASFAFKEVEFII